MPVSAVSWHGDPMTTSGGPGRGPGERGMLSHVPIVIPDSSVFTAPGEARRVVYAMVMVKLLVLARATGSAIGAARSDGSPPSGVAGLGGTA